ncbi:D-alanyl-D-alanine carboxypeptidase/D-alanyl-D-alanine-endopeptidase [Nocardioides sp. GY 10127]|uniref:D-alanyl-D-alanine carboxypeptidase/D-alanyl-D-alanine endopeptidase n=1 Tax=Nocardioides sp. GY 10127 TaxID=2569762 RepID=UPI0010A8207C|nr:D-alanyl-D-alanine carboxypeptidase/D-alanyl-D-alanine-endopeptidase [Nocardioides sp. GY 10127]TIC79382.1 D-alanyl-D-alanine carboxypeptidase/D-alanyl-D-alanine-endopeptidase [Nocardioides sp. GY 10127]
MPPSDARHSPGGGRRAARRADRAARRAAAQSDSGRRRRWPRRVALGALALVLVGTGVVVSGVADPVLAPVADPLTQAAQDALDGLSDATSSTSGTTRETDPALVEAPSGLDLATPTPAAAAAEAATSSALSRSAVRAVLRKALKANALGGHVSAAVADLDGDLVLDTGGAAIPASTTKLLTSAAALETVGAGTTFATTTVRQGRTVVLVGGGDPFLASSPTSDDTWPARADVTTLARRTAAALVEQLADAPAKQRRLRVAYDDSLFSGPAFNTSWPASYRGEVAPPTSALWVDEGTDLDGSGDYSSTPAADAASVFDSALAAALAQQAKRTGVTVTLVGTTSRTTASASATDLAAVHSATVAQIVQQLLQVSDNNAAEVLLRQVGLATSGTGSTAAGLTGVRHLLRSLDVELPVRQLDGSGLSRRNRIDPATLVGLLAAAADSDDDSPLRGLFPGLPAAGSTGSLAYRFTDAPAAAVGHVRAKTGTLTNVTSLAGIALDRNGVPMVFALMADDVADADALTGREALDDAAAALAACACGVGASD